MLRIKPRTRRKLTKQLKKLVKRHGADTALALVSGIVSTLTPEGKEKPASKGKPASAVRRTRARARSRH